PTATVGDRNNAPDQAAATAGGPRGARNEQPPGAAPVLSANRLSVDISWLALLRKIVEVQAIELDGFALSVDRGRDGALVLPAAETPQHLDVTLPTIDAANLALLISESGIGPGTLTLDAGLRDGTLHVAATIEQRAAGPALETHLVLANLPIGDARLYVPYVG